MGFQRFIESLILIMVFLLEVSQCYQFYVGGKDGWVLNPSENYTVWPHRHRFQVNDTLFFKYKKGADSVLIVSKDDFESCNTKNPKQSLTDGDSIFKFDNSGPFYFISGESDHCKNGQKLHIIVMAIRPKPSSPNAPPQSPSSPPVTSPSLPPVESSAPSPADLISQPPPQSANSGSEGFTGFVRVVLGASFGVTVILGSFAGI
ncbi:early nodulin-like protein 4 [Euphorbia lathyris]|uniref:early nodulin-like protein 4 n=1 Tax=Euphorbia lathyris TaxID=212925 RepID=UPI003313F79B